jgi:hypothetical protein
MLSDHMDLEEETSEVKCSFTFVKEMDLLPPRHGLRSLREDCTAGKQQDIKININCPVYPQNISSETV